MNRYAESAEQIASLKEVYEELRILQKRRLDVWTRKATMVTAFLALGAWKLGESYETGILVALALPLVCLLFDLQLMNTTISIKRARAFLWDQSPADSTERKWSAFLNCPRHRSCLTRWVADGFTTAVFVVSIFLFSMVVQADCLKELGAILWYAILGVIYCKARSYEKCQKKKFDRPCPSSKEAKDKTCGDKPL